ncbi:MAG: PEP-CTERM sorting domain-containing protein [Myxococcota bacterium]|nr:PEP-CTERM sorting domain-containing protein [Myxococcota bacterium]
MPECIIPLSFVDVSWLNGSVMKPILRLIFLLCLLLAGQASAVTVVGSLAGQEGWSGGASPGFTNNGAQPPSSNSDLFYDGDWHGEAVTTADARSGDQSWLFRNGYDSPGSGTPFSPALSASAGQPSSGAAGTGFSASFWFKAAGAAGDGSRIMIAGGNPAGNDRSSNYLEIENTLSGIVVRSYNGVTGSGWDSTELLVATGLGSDSWHQLTMTGEFLDGPDNDFWTYQVNGGPSVIGGAYFETARDNFGFAYEVTNRLKFQPRHANYDPAASGFYFDDLETTVFDSGGVLASYSTGFEVPEPSTAMLLALGFGWLSLARRRNR